MRSLRPLLLGLFLLHGFVSLSSASKLLVTNATIVTLAENQPASFTGWLLIGEDGRIASVAAGAPPSSIRAQTTYDATGKIVMPGFLSGHSHLWQSAFRGIAADQWVTAWVQRIHRTYGPHFIKGDPYAFTLHGALDYLRHGVTTTYNYSQSVSGPNQELYEEQFQAELDAGARFIFGYAALSPLPSIEESQRRFEAFMATKAAAQKANPLLLKINIAAGAGPATAAPEFIAMQSAMLKKYGLEMQMHFLEPPSSRETNQSQFEAIEKAGYVGPGFTYAHFIHTNDYILEKVGKAGGGMIWNPLSNGRLASGLPDIPKYIKAGISIGMGIDGQASADVSDPFENMRMGLYGLRMMYKDASIMQPIDILKLHTIGTARTMGVAKDVGTLEVGKFGDFLVVDPANFDTGPVFDVCATLVFACKISNLEQVYVGGEKAIQNGQPLKHSMSAISADVHKRVAAVRARTTAATPAAP